jgi:outer membrane lipoprotein LolB
MYFLAHFLSRALSRFFTHLLVFLLVSMMLAGCVSLHVPSTPASMIKRSSMQTQQLRRLNQWQIDGAFALSTPKQNDLANYRWRQNNQSFVIDVSSALNAVRFRVSGHPGRVVLTGVKGGPVEAPYAETLLRRVLGWQLPVSGLQYWIRGLAAPGSHDVQKDSLGRFKVLTQQGWRINYLSYQYNYCFCHITSY